ncbi:hypothetical protein BN2537_17321 [Streptomyces venezuelae]|nr:hypothetical protein BN2537_17321 [Streptomyces venezuelae]
MLLAGTSQPPVQSRPVRLLDALLVRARKDAEGAMFARRRRTELGSTALAPVELGKHAAASQRWGTERDCLNPSGQRGIDTPTGRPQAPPGGSWW